MVAQMLQKFKTFIIFLYFFYIYFIMFIIFMLFENFIFYIHLIIMFYVLLFTYILFFILLYISIFILYCFKFMWWRSYFHFYLMFTQFEYENFIIWFLHAIWLVNSCFPCVSETHQILTFSQCNNICSDWVQHEQAEVGCKFLVFEISLLQIDAKVFI